MAVRRAFVASDSGKFVRRVAVCAFAGTHRSHSISDRSRRTWKFERNFRKDDGDVTGVGIIGDHYSQRYVETPFTNISGRVRVHQRK